MSDGRGRFQSLQSLFHITRVENLSSIARSGLTSHNHAHAGLQPKDISDPDVQERRRRKSDPIYRRPLHDYVPLYFRARNPMLYVRREMQERLAVLYVEKSVLCGRGVVFTDGNAAADKTRYFSSVDDLAQLDWACLEATDWTAHVDGKRKRCAEVLVPDAIPKGRIKRIVVADERAERSIGREPWHGVDVAVRREWFF